MANKYKSSRWREKAPSVFLRLQELFFSADFNTLTMAEQSVYFRAGWLIFVMGEIPDDPFVVAQFTMMDARDVEKHWPRVKSHFVTLSNGNLTDEWWTRKREASFGRQARAMVASKLGATARANKKGSHFDGKNITGGKL